MLPNHYGCVKVRRSLPCIPFHLVLTAKPPEPGESYSSGAAKLPSDLPRGICAILQATDAIIWEETPRDEP